MAQKYPPNRKHTFVWLALLAVLAIPAFLPAQVTTARLEGIVVDKTNAVIPGVTVVVINVGTNIPYEA
ncbi:MAG: carboxypeptidase regulatory-like domain-containing protein, partial [Acidobacteria bacterium]|nr:carboxypeptidase regulatory-like domain-containing protein [Acidobacteriota bacterium]